MPTFKEQGYDLTMGAYYFLFAPKNLPQPVQAWLLTTFQKAMQSTLFTKPVEASGLFVHYQGPKELKERLWKDYNASAALVKAMNKGSKGFPP